jgi:hypothetical protein
MQKINLPKIGINIYKPSTLQKTTRLINNVGCFLLQTNKGENIMFMKKMFLALIIAVMTTMATFAQSNENQTKADEASVRININNADNPTGSWMGVVTNTQGGPPPFRVLMNFTADGGFTGSGDGDNSVGSPQYGVWERVSGGRISRQQFAVTFRQLFYDANANPTGSAKIRQAVILSPSGDSWQGPFKVEIFAPDGTLVFSGGGTAAATRIQSEPLP